MPKCCATCNNRYILKQYDYSGKGCVHKDMPGFICMALESEGQATWMFGTDPKTGRCEMYMPIKRKSLFDDRMEWGDGDA